MAKFKITFIGAKDDEEVEADYFQDNPPFVDFMVRDETSDYTNVVARYRQDAIQRILRL